MSLWQKISKLLFVTLCCVTLLTTTACSGYYEKQDIMALGNLFKQLGYEGKDKEYKQKLHAAKNDDEVKAVIEEFIPIFEKTPQEIRKLKMKSKEGKKLQKEIADSFEKLSGIVRKMLTINPNDTEAIFQLNKEATEDQMQMQQVQMRLFTLAGKHGLKMNE